MTTAHTERRRVLSSVRDHVWTPLSRHATSEGWIVYEQCRCGALRISRQQGPGEPSQPLSSPVWAPRRPPP